MRCARLMLFARSNSTTNQLGEILIKVTGWIGLATLGSRLVNCIVDAHRLGAALLNEIPPGKLFSVTARVRYNARGEWRRYEKAHNDSPNFRPDSVRHTNFCVCRLSSVTADRLCQYSARHHNNASELATIQAVYVRGSHCAF